MSVSEKTGAAVWDLGEPENLKDRAVKALIKGIREETFKEGSLLPPEAELGTALRVSRSVLREAIKQLEVLGFVRIERGIGTRVQAPDFRCITPVVEFLGAAGRIAFADLHNLRMLVEVEAVGLVAVDHSPALVEDLQRIINESMAHIDEEQGYVDLDFAFHKRLVEACPNRLLPLTLAPFDAYLRRSRTLSFHGPAATQQALRVHRAIWEAVRDHNPAAARARMKAHLEETAHDLGLA